jgi:cardiolipin synthase
MPTLPWSEIAIILYVAWIAGAGATVLTQRRSPTATLAWLLAFAALPVLSGIYYVVFGPRRLHRRKLRYGLARRNVARDVAAYLRGTAHPTPALAADAAALAGVVGRLGQGGPTAASRVELLEDGDACVAAIVAAIDGARHHVHCEYYIWEDDGTGTRVRDALAAAAARGVQVRVLVDALGSAGAGGAFWVPLEAARGELRRFNPLRFSIASLNFASFRTHRKIVVVDGGTGFLGGINLHDEESAAASGARAWRDLHARIDGEPVRRLQRLFLEDWAYAGGTLPADLEAVKRYFPPPPGEPGPPVQVLASGPDVEDAPIHAFLLAALAGARRRAWLQTPYLVPDEPLESALRIAVLRGVDVQVIVPRRGDSRLVGAASRTYCEALGRAGVRVFEYLPGMLHTKAVVIDDTVAMVGTANLDNRSFRLNFEVAAAFYDAEVVARVARRFDEDRERSRAFRGRGERSRAAAFLESVARLTAPVL